MKNILFVGGTFDDSLDGRPSSVCDKMIDVLYTYCMSNNINFVFQNGGNFTEIKNILNSVCDYDVIFWFPNISNDKIKFRNIKELNPRTILITSKRNDDNKYNYSQLINQSLNLKSNLFFEFSKKSNNLFNIKILDPLGNLFYDDISIEDSILTAIYRVEILSNMTRVNSCQIGEAVEIPDKTDFFDLVRNYAEVFHELINPDINVTRFLGNSSFRCQRGFPSFRGSNDLIYVSRRNVDKRFIDKDNFVRVKYNKSNNMINYWGNNKPSVDTPIQLMLYDKYPNINYMIHSHCYIKGAGYTNKIIPCGAIEEVNEITNILETDSFNFYTINLLGHGCLVMSNNVGKMKNIQFKSRSMPEIVRI